MVTVKLRKMGARMSSKCSGLWKIVVVMVLIYIFTLLIVHSSLQLSQVEFSVGIRRRKSISEEADEISGLLRERKIEAQFGDNHGKKAVSSLWKRKWWRSFFIFNTESNMAKYEEQQEFGQTIEIFQQFQRKKRAISSLQKKQTSLALKREFADGMSP